MFEANAGERSLIPLLSSGGSNSKDTGGATVDIEPEIHTEPVVEDDVYSYRWDLSQCGEKLGVARVEHVRRSAIRDKTPGHVRSGGSDNCYAQRVGELDYEVSGANAATMYVASFT